MRAGRARAKVWGSTGTSQEGWGSVYNGPVIDAHTHPMLGIDDQVGAEEHPPEAYRKLVSGSAIIFGSDYPPDDPLGAIRAVGQLGFGEPELQAILHDNAASLLSHPAGE